MKPPGIRQTVLDTLAEHYGLAGSLRRLPGENLNYLLTDQRKIKRVIKIVDKHQPPDVVQMEFAVIEHAVAAGFQPRLPRIYVSKNGKIETRIEIRRIDDMRLRVIEFLPGKGMSDLIDISDLMLINLGRSLAQFNRAMADFDHPAAHRDHRWNLANVLQHEDKITLVGEPRRQDLLRWAYDGWRACSRRLASVPHQVIHGDAHDENVLVDGDEMCGLIDFGDCCYNPTVCELAICLAYLMQRRADPVEVMRLVLQGYESVRPLGEDERSLLFPLVCARLAVSVSVAAKRRTIDPDNPNWFGGEARSWRFLELLRDRGSLT